MKITREALKNIVREAMIEENEYQQFFAKALEKAGKSIPQMSDDEKKAFFNKIDATWDGKGEKNEGNAFGVAVAKAKQQGDDEFEVDGKEYDVEEGAVVIHTRTSNGNISSRLKEEDESLNEEEIKWNAVENAIINFLKMNTKILDKRVKDRDADGVKGGLKSIINGLTNAQRSLKLESVNEDFKAVVGKTIFSDGKGKLFFGYYKEDDSVHFVDYKTWKGLSFKDVSKGNTNKERVIKAILKNQKQFNKKVDFNMWAKKTNPSFEQTMDWFIQNGWISNINKGGIKESVDIVSVNEAMDIKVGDMVKVDNPHWEGALGKKGPFRRKVKAIYDDNVFFTDGSNSSMKYIKK
jgi:hypothetical protein